MDVGNKVIKGMKIGTGLRFVGQLFTWFNTLFLVRLLTPEDYGLMAMTMVFVAALALMSDFGITKAIMHVEEITPQLLRQAFSVNLMAGVSLFIFFWIAAPYIGDFFSEPRIILFIRVIAVQHLLIIFQTLPYALSSRYMRYKEREWIQFVATITTSIFTITLALLGYGAWSLVLGHLFLRMVLVVGFNWLQPCWVMPTFNFYGFAKTAIFSGISTINDGLRLLLHMLPTISIGRWLSKVDLGVFSVVQNLANLPCDKIGELLNHVGFSSFARIKNDKQLASQYLLKSIRLGSLILFPMYLGMSVVATELIPLFLSDKWIVAIVPFQIMCLASPLRMLSEILATASSAIGYPKRNTWALLGTLFLLPSIFLGLRYGVVGVCLTWFGISFLSFLLHIKMMLKLFVISYRQLFSAIFPSFFCGLVMFVVTFKFRMYFINDFNDWLLFVSMIVVGIVSFTGLMFLFFKKSTMATLHYLRH